MTSTPTNQASEGQNREVGTDMLTTHEAARLLGLAPSTLNKWRLYGLGPRFVKLGRAVRYRRPDVDAYLASHTHTSTRT
ncbi:helix-turn-helix transcriptional regulator [Kordiimonas sp.]|uniref:helix-turn-helix transcriptional regulator n=1 Tax=Kordiimonas sp. TaxID=1970157 RepID=UPI003A933019